MVRRHFIAGDEKPDFIITYYAPHHIPFSSNYKGVLRGYDNIDTFGDENNTVFKCVLDKWEDGIGEYRIKILNWVDGTWYNMWSYRQSVDLTNINVGALGFYVDIENKVQKDVMSFDHSITDVILPNEIKHLNGPLVSSYLDEYNISIVNVRLPENLETLSDHVLRSLHVLKTITIPSSVIYMGNNTLKIDCDSSNIMSLSPGNQSLEEIIMKPIIPPNTDILAIPIGTYSTNRYINPNLKIRVYADCIDTYKNDTVWGQYSELYAGIQNKVITYTDDNRNIEHVDLINSLYNYKDYEKLYITSELSSSVRPYDFTHLSAKYLYIENSKYDSRNNCNAIIETETNTLLKGTENTIIPNTVTHIGNTDVANHHVFKRNNVPHTLNIPDSVIRVYSGAFDAMTFHDLIIGKNCKFDNFNFSVTNTITVPENHISYLPSTNNIISKDNILYKGTNITIIPDYITSITNNAFIGNHISYLDTNTVTEIYTDAFINCSIEHLYISELLRKLDPFYFGTVFNNTIINNITISENNTLFRIENNNLIQNEDNMLVKAFNNTNVIPDGVEKIGQQAYYGQNITSINIPTNIKSIHSSAFTNTPIETNNDYWIDDSLFCINDWLVDVLLNTQTSKLTIPENITKIGGHLQRPGLEVLDCLGDILYISERAFTSSSLTTLTMNSAVNLKYIGKYAFSSSNLGFISFKGCTDLYIGQSAFENCQKLFNVYIDDGVSYIGERAFYNCSNLDTVELIDSPSSTLTTIEPYTFAYCKIKNICIPRFVTSIESNAFKGCSDLTSVFIGGFGNTIKGSLTSIGDTAFSGCTSLTSITYNGPMWGWESIEKGNNWNYGVPATVVHCTDGDIDI